MASGFGAQLLQQVLRLFQEHEAMYSSEVYAWLPLTSLAIELGSTQPFRFTAACVQAFGQRCDATDATMNSPVICIGIFRGAGDLVRTYSVVQVASGVLDPTSLKPKFPGCQLLASFGAPPNSKLSL